MRKVRKIGLGFLLAVAITIMVVPAYAIESHEDPDTSLAVFSGISILLYCSDSLDLILQKNVEGTQAYLKKIPFANIPDDLLQSTSEFGVSGIQLSKSISEISKLWDKQKQMVEQYRLEESDELFEQISTSLPFARGQLMKVENSIKQTGSYLNVDSMPLGSDLKLMYNEVTDKISRLHAMLKTFGTPLNSPDYSPDLDSTQLTLEVDQTTVFVGDVINFIGHLSSSDVPLVEREVDILLNDTSYITVKTDEEGYFQGELLVPYWYIPQIEVQALYYPQNDDIGIYIASSSQTIILEIQFYVSHLDLRTEGEAYPGKQLALIGFFDYGTWPISNSREAEIYLDDILVEEFIAQMNFTQTIQIDPLLVLGKHVMTVSIVADKRYAPVAASCMFDIIKALPILNLNSRGLVFVPGTIGLTGTLQSDIGPLEKAVISIKSGQKQVLSSTSVDGSFRAYINRGLEWTLLGSESLTIEVKSQEPWNASLVATRRVFIINYINCGLLLIICIILAFRLPRIVEKQFEYYRQTGKRKVPATPSLGSSQTNGIRVQATAEDININDREDETSLLYWYRKALKTVEKVTRILLKPNQTLREYAQENEAKLGPAGKYFLEVTSLIEKLLYAPLHISPQELEKGKKLSQAIKDARNEIV